MSESDSFEEKSQFDWTPKQSLDLLKDLVAFANTNGGIIRLNQVMCDHDRLDSAKIDDFIHTKAAPRIDGITSRCIDEATWEISVPPSASAPHVLTGDLGFLKNGDTKCIGWRGDVYVRHSSKTELATAEDFQKMFQKRLGFWLSKIGQGIQSFSVGMDSGQFALPVKLSADEVALKIGVTNPNREYPYTTASLAKMVRRSQNWVAYATKKLSIKDNPLMALEIKGSRGSTLVWKYNEQALKALREKLREDPSFNPRKG